MEQAVIWSIPFLALAVGLEMVISIRRGRPTYRTNDTLASLSQGLISQLMFACTPLLQVGLYTMLFLALGHSADAPFWNHWQGFGVAVVLFDFCEYWLHRAGHEVAVLWAAHAVHHQSEELNFCTALRQESQNAVLGWPFYLPMALVGVPPLIFGFSYLFVQYSQIWAHTEQVGKLGWLDRVFTTPSNHRVHHAVNDCYIDHNYGGLFVLWDRLFGTYKAETEPCVYGTRAPLRSFNPLRAVVQVYAALARDAWHARLWRDKIKVWFMPPGWRPADVEQRFPQAPFTPLRERYDPPASGAARAAAIGLFLATAAACGVFLWNAESMDSTARFVWMAVLIVPLCGVGWLLERQPSTGSAHSNTSSPAVSHVDPGVTDSADTSTNRTA